MAKSIGRANDKNDHWLSLMNIRPIDGAVKHLPMDFANI